MGRSAARSTVVKLGVTAVLAALVTCLVLVCVWWSRPVTLSHLVSPGAAAGFNVLLVTLDTTRADHLSCYGYRAAQTPTIDSLVDRGVIFDHAFTPVPVTLPAHATIMTGLEPFRHGVRCNGQYQLREDHVTLSEVLAAEGYTTAAFVASFALDERFGLNQGFETYDFRVSDEGRRGPLSFENERHAGHVTDAALHWLDAQNRAADSDPFFMWLHYYDPHAPYAPPHDSRLARPTSLIAAYDAEIAFVDTQLQRLMSALDERQLRDETLVVLVSDHGEALGDHGEDEHSGFIYDETVRVAWILSCPALFASQHRVDDRIVGLVDVAPTILELLGVVGPTDMDGLGQFTAPFDPDRAIYLETLLTKEQFACAPLHGLRRLSDKLIVAPRSEYYDLRNDRRELENLWDRSDSECAALTDRLKTIMRTSESATSAERVMSDDEVRRLASLGYVAFQTGDSTTLADPKDRIPMLGELRGAIALMQQGRLREALTVAREKAVAMPGVDTPVLLMAQIHKRLGQRDAALEALKEYSDRYVSLEVLVGLAIVHFELGQFDEMEAVLQAVEHQDPRRGVVSMIRGDRYFAEGRYEEAARAYAVAIELDGERIGPMGSAKLEQARALIAQATP